MSTDPIDLMLADFRKELPGYLKSLPEGADVIDAVATFYERRFRDVTVLVPEKLLWMREYEKSLNRRVSVEDVLGQVATGKRDLLTPDECRDLEFKLGVPEDWRR